MEYTVQQGEGGRFAEDIVVVTGGASGIGAAIARAFSAEGAGVAILDAAFGAAQSLANELDNTWAFECDVSVPDAVDHAIDRIVFDLGVPTVGVNNAGIAGSRDEVTRRSRAMEGFTTELLASLEPPKHHVDLLTEISDADWRRTFAVNVDGTFFVTRRLVREMRAHHTRRPCSIINMSSVCGLVGCIGTPSYSAAKAAIIGFTKAVAKELGGTGIRVNAVAPGYIDTSLSPVRSSTERALTIAQTPLGRLGTPEEVAKTVLFLASQDSSYFTGAVLSPNGGVVTG